MPLFKYLLFAVLVCSFVTAASARQTATSPPQAAAILQRSLTSLAGPQNLADVTLSGTARRIAGSDDESGTVVLKALADGSAKIQFSLPSGNRSESRSSDSSGPAGASAGTPAGAWPGPDGAAHPILFYIPSSLVYIITHPAQSTPPRPGRDRLDHLPASRRLLLNGSGP